MIQLRIYLEISRLIMSNNKPTFQWNFRHQNANVFFLKPEMQPIQRVKNQFDFNIQKSNDSALKHCI